MEIKIGLWEKKSQKGNKYNTGKFKLEDKGYKVMLFTNDKKGNEKAPDFNLIIRSIDTQEEQKNVEIPPKSEPSKDVYERFGEISIDDFPEEPF